MNKKTQKCIIESVYELICLKERCGAFKNESNVLKFAENHNVFYYIEIYSGDIAGCYSWIDRKVSNDKYDDLNTYLVKSSIADNQEILIWLSDNSKHYPNFAEYIHLNEYLRLMMIDYFSNMTTSNKENAADKAADI